GCRIIDGRVVRAEITGYLVGRWQRLLRGLAKTFHCRFKPDKEEQLVLYDASADRAAIDIAQAVGRFVPIEEKVPGVRDSVLVQRKGGAVEIIRSRFGDHRRRGAAGKPRLGVE